MSQTQIPKQYVYSQEAASEAAKVGKFIAVGGAKAQSRTWNMRGASNMWAGKKNKDGPQVIYNVKYRIAGTPEDIAYALKVAGYDDRDIDEVIQDSISAQNYRTSKAEQYQAEIKFLKDQGPKLRDTQGLTLSHILWYSNPATLKKARVVTKSGSSAASAPSSAPVARSPAKKARTLSEQVEQARQSGKVVDVSKFEKEKGKIINRPGPKSGKKGSRVSDNRPFELPVISSDINNYIAALRVLFGDRVNEYQEDIDSVRQQLPSGQSNAQSNIPPPPLPSVRTPPRLSSAPSFQPRGGLPMVGGGFAANIPPFRGQ